MAKRVEPESGGSLGTILKGFGALAASNIAGQILGFLALAIVTRRIGADALGDYNFALTVSTYFGLAANLGTSLVGMRDLSRRPDAGVQIVSETFTLQALASVASYGILITAATAVAPTDRAADLLPITGLSVIVTALTLDWVLLALGARGWTAGARFAGQFVYAASVPIAVAAGASGVYDYAWLNLAGLVVTAVIGYAWLRRNRVRVRLRLNGRLIVRLRRSAYFGYSLVMIQVYNVVDVLMLGYMTSSREVGLYTAASRLPYAVVALANLWVQAFLPHAARLYETDPGQLRRDVANTLTAAIVVTLGIATGGWILSEDLVTGMFGEESRDATTAFGLLSVGLSLVLVEAILSNALIAAHRDRRYALILTAAAGLNVALNVPLISLIGVDGAAASTAATELFLVAVTFLAVRNQMGAPWPAMGRVLRGCFSAGLFAACLLITETWPLLPRIACGVAVFTAAVLATRAIHPSMLASRPPTSSQ